MNFNFGNIQSDEMMVFGMVWTVLPMIGAVLVHLAFSAAVYNDANRLQKEPGALTFVGAWLWALAVLIGGVFVALAYWVIHHSTIVKR